VSRAGSGRCARSPRGFPVDANGAPYVLTPDKIPFILFGPLSVLIARRGWSVVRRVPWD
jgi:hypothetical protein